MKLFLPTVIASVVLLLSGSTDALNVKVPGVNYNSRKGPDWAPDNQRCKTASEVQKDMYAIKAVSDKVRIYSLLDCNQAEFLLPAAKNAGLQVHLGIWTTNSHDYLLQEKNKLASLIDSGLVDNNVIGLHVGSETIYREEITADTAISYMNEIRDYIRSRGLNTPVTIADVIDIYYGNQQLIDAVDYISVNQFSFWERADVNEGAAITLDRLKSLRQVATQKNKKIVISEVGWSSNGEDPAASVSSPENQVKFFSDFFQMARSHNFDYYWYIAFDSQWRVTNGGKAVEANFGMFKEDDSMKSNFQQLTIGWKDPRAIRNAGTNLLLSENGGEVYMSAKSNDWLVQEQQVWFFDSATQQVRSKSSDRCLDAYQAWDGGIVHVYRCIESEANQKWSLESETGKLKHATHQGFCLDQDAGQNNKLQLETAEFLEFHGGIVHMWSCNANEVNQRWNLDAATNQLKHVTHSGLCLDADLSANNGAGKLQLWGCHMNNNNQVWRVIPMSAMAATVHSSNVNNAYLQPTTQDTVVGAASTGKWDQHWFWDANSNHLISKLNGQCLDAYEAQQGGRVHTYACIASEGNQKWNYDATNQIIKHAKHSGFCLAFDNLNNKLLQLKSCNVGDNTQRIKIAAA
ncbi:hypothetical protein BBO99_00006575 [Phytophthora kernoviae]|uniref:glucan endo-1,3-beta-D-glucosidase n=1 Tax=Phytophthora kernoviae TaxID=325452 RepID=A0A3R7J3U9_9STRA|nr:hypothetical protein JM18_005989 [Phytophthora kernoviae]RLN14968.1 hypothetical protein BBI17_006592 [Phytophthora kernoviae]RLN77672.1 hypothetical protein BBO99_00006575 [Phytophthora kernoviae]